ncbi:hypothetical protein LX36DRAFT_649063 [Colletotrichum falcatum]|nr:hypothetical protein LX36DRAFT_649063 [Colletotrichum falcatum]
MTVAHEAHLFAGVADTYGYIVCIFHPGLGRGIQVRIHQLHSPIHRTCTCDTSSVVSVANRKGRGGGTGIILAARMAFCSYVCMYICIRSSGSFGRAAGSALEARLWGRRTE